MRAGLPLPTAKGLALPQLTVGIVIEDEIGRRRVTSILESGGLDVVGHSPRPEQLIERCGGHDPDAVVLVWDRLEPARDAGLHRLRQGLPGARIVGVAASASRKAIREALSQGADGLVMESQLEDSLALAVRTVCSGQLSLPRELREHVSKPALSAREKQILGMVVMGFSNGEIAGKLYLAESTVKNHLSSAFAKLGVRSRNEAAALILDPHGGLGTGILAISEADSEAAMVGAPR